MNTAYTAGYEDQVTGDNMFSGRNSYLAVAGDPNWHRSCAFTDDGRYKIKYQGTNYGGKVTTVEETITVEFDEFPILTGNLLDVYYRERTDIHDKKTRAKIVVLGPVNDRLTIQSPDGDYINTVISQVTFDSNNDKVFNSSDTVTEIPYSSGTQLTNLYHLFKKYYFKDSCAL